MYRQHRLREIGLRRGVSRDKNGLWRGLTGLNRTLTFDPCTPCLQFCTPTFKMLPNNLLITVKIKVCKASIPRTVYLTVLSLLNAHFLSQSIAIINILLSQFRNGFHGNVYIHI